MKAATPAKLDIPVVCIGNVVAGGAGKTPVAISVAKALKQMGASPGFLSRGYGGRMKVPTRVDPDTHSANDVGDEPLLLSRIAPTWVARDRRAGAAEALAGGIDILVMDDGLQNPALYKDFSLLVVDGGYGFGNGKVLPAGPLRESVDSAFSRVQAVAVIGPDRTSVRTELPTGVPVLSARFVPCPESDDISGRPVVAFAGIGRPEKFFETLAGMGCELIETKAFPDHHLFSGDELMQLIDIAADRDAVVVTTEKDFVRISVDAQPMIRPLRVELEWQEPEILSGVLSAVLRPGT